jgi:hypothetical protein
MKSTTYRSYPQNPQLPVDNSLIILMGGRGWSLVVIVVGASSVLKKANWKKRGNTPVPD